MASGGLTYAQMVSMMRLIVRRHYADDARYVQDLLPYFVNAAYHEIDRKLRWTRCTYDITTVAEQREYVVPSSVREYLHVTYTDDESNLAILEPISFREWTEERALSDDSGTPSFYVHHGDRIYLQPMPETAGETVTIYVVGEPPTLANDDDKPGFPVHLHELIIDQALVYVHRHFGETQTSVQLDEIIQRKLDYEAHAAAIKRGGAGRVEQRGA